jgi:hypothetical protein
MDFKDLKLALDKESRLKSAFRAVKFDIDLMSEKHDTLKQSANDWILFLHHENHDLRTRVKDLERKMAVIESALDHEKMSVLREV